MAKKKVALYAYYLPQFHETQENNIWWGKGFTEWNNVQGAKPLFTDHFQPRVPLNNNYYDLSNPKEIAKQAELANEYGLTGFSIYYFWSSGVQLLHKPMELIMQNKSININFHITWANHDWTRSWKNNSGNNDQILLKQTYESVKNSREKHYNYIYNLMRDSRYTLLNDKPLFNIYRPYDIPDVISYLDDLREYILKKLGSEIHINSMIQYPPKDITFKDSVDSVSLFQPGTVMFNTDSLSNSKVTATNLTQHLKSRLINSSGLLKSFLYRFKPKGIKEYDYDKVWQVLLAQSEQETYLGKPIIRGAFVDWDNTARYGKEATIFHNASPYKFGKYLKELLKIVETSDSSEKLIYINSWNEWGESAYLEPDERHKYGYLQAIKDLSPDL